MENKDTQGLALYESPLCGYCFMTKRVIDKLDIDIEYRNIAIHSKHRQELIKQGGKQQVPCLRIEKNGHTQWLYESADIIKFLKDQYG